MKRLFLLVVVSIVTASCASLTLSQNELLKTTATYQKMGVSVSVTPLQADLKVSNTKVDYFMPVSSIVAAGGVDNAIATAIHEVLARDGSDVLVGLQTQVRYDSYGSIESVRVSGYPAKYINFRNKEVGQEPTIADDKDQSFKVSIVNGKSSK